MGGVNYCMSRNQLLSLIQNMYLEGYHCGWGHGWGKEQALDHWIEENGIEPLGKAAGGYQPVAAGGPINPPPRKP